MAKISHNGLVEFGSQHNEKARFGHWSANFCCAYSFECIHISKKNFVINPESRNLICHLLSR